MRVRYLVAWVVLGLWVALSPAADFDIRDQKQFDAIVPHDARVEKVAGEFGFLEGPAWWQDSLIFSDEGVPDGVVYRWTPDKGAVAYQKPSDSTNGNIVDRDGNLISCRQSTRCITRTDKDGKVTVLADKCDGKRFSSPNDVTAKSDGSIWFTDPPYGLRDHKDKQQAKNCVFRADPKAGTVAIATDELEMPNGLCFSPDGKKLYVADSGKAHQVHVFDVAAGQPDAKASAPLLSNGKVFCIVDPGVPDGMRVDGEGRLYVAAGDGVQIFTPDGTRIATLYVPEVPANVCFGGADGHTLFITARHSVYRIRLNTAAPK